MTVGRTVLTPDDPRHGTTNGYGNLGCRCDECRRANTLQMREYQRRLGKRTKAEYLAEIRARPISSHGTEAGYRRGCRCDLCREEANRQRALRRRRERRPSLAVREREAVAFLMGIAFANMLREQVVANQARQE